MNTLAQIIIVAILLLGSVNALDPECSAHELCRGLSGFCCPTTEFVYLECCEGFGAECSLYPACERLGLEDFCCPTAVSIVADDHHGATILKLLVSIFFLTFKDGEMLECCGESNPDGPSSCSAYQQCNDMGHTGECCPTIDGMSGYR